MEDAPTPAFAGGGVLGVSVGIDPGRGIVVTLERDDFAFSAVEARQLAALLLRAAQALDPDGEIR
jgi:hypothetical protein